MPVLRQVLSNFHSPLPRKIKKRGCNKEAELVRRFQAMKGRALKPLRKRGSWFTYNYRNRNDAPVLGVNKKMRTKRLLQHMYPACPLKPCIGYLSSLVIETV